MRNGWNQFPTGHGSKEQRDSTNDTNKHDDDADALENDGIVTTIVTSKSKVSRTRCSQDDEEAQQQRGRIDAPKPTDILLGREELITTSPGHIVFRELRASRFDEYDALGKRRLEKTKQRVLIHSLKPIDILLGRGEVIKTIPGNIMFGEVLAARFDEDEALGK